MALSGGHWDNLTALKKATQPTLIPGTIEEDVKRGNPLMILPMAQANHTGSSIKWLRQDPDKTAEGDVTEITVGGQTSWTEGVDYDEKESELKICYLQRKLDKYVPAIYGTFNNYEEIMLQEMLDGMAKQMGDRLIYGDTTYGSSLQCDGLHAWAAENTNDTDINKDMAGGALSMATWRKLFQAMKQGIDFWLIPYEIGNHIDAAYQEVGFVGLKATTAGTMAGITWGVNQMGEPMNFFCGKPIIRTDFLVGETDDSGRGTTSASARTKDASGVYSIFGIKLGTAALAARDPGAKIIFGQPEETDVADGKMVFLEYFNKLEGYIGKGIRIGSYYNFISGGSMAVGRIFDIQDTAIVV